MELRTQSPMRNGPRVTRLWRGTIASELGFIFLTVLLVMVVGLPFSCAIAMSIRAVLGGSLAAPVGIATFLLLIVAIMIFVERIRPRKQESWNKFRFKRLNWVLERPDALSRVPHRFVEFQQLVYSMRSRSMMRQLSRIPSGEIVLIDSLRTAPLPFFQSSMAFEPVQWNASESLLAMPMTGIQVISGETNASGHDNNALIKKPTKRANNNIGWIVVPAIAVASMARASMRGQALISALNWSHLILAVIAFSMTIAAFRYFVVGRQYYLVPGGLVRLENGLRFRTPKLALLTPNNTSLVLYREGGVYLLTEGSSAFVATDAEMIQALLIAWLSQARRPTMQELRTLLIAESAACVEVGKTG